MKRQNPRRKKKRSLGLLTPLLIPLFVFAQEVTHHRSSGITKRDKSAGLSVYSPALQSAEGSDSFFPPDEPPVDLRNSVMKIVVKGLNAEGRSATVRGTGLVFQDTQRQIRAATNFHIPDSVEMISDIFIESPQGDLKLTLEAVHPFYDMAFLKFRSRGAKKAVAPLRINPDPVLSKKAWYYMAHPAPHPLEEGHTIPLRYLSYTPDRRQITFAVTGERDSLIHLSGLSGSPILDKQGRVIAVFNSYLSKYLFGTIISRLTEGAPRDFVKCSGSGAGQARACILKARKQLFQKTKSKNKTLRLLTWDIIKELYSDNFTRFIRSLQNPKVSQEAPELFRKSLMGLHPAPPPARRKKASAQNCPAAF